MDEWRTYDHFQTSLTRRLLAWAGIVVQGAALLAFDVVHAVMAESENPL
jgi:hypothetical protein